MTLLDIFVLWPLIILGIAILVLKPVTVPEDERWVTELFHQYFRTLGPGLHFMVRFFEEIAQHRQPDGTFRERGIRSTREHAHHFKVNDTITEDGVIISKIVGVIRTRMKTEVEDPRAAYKNAYTLEIPISEAIDALSDEVVRTIVGSHVFEYVKNNQEQFQNEIAAKIKLALDRWGEWFLQLDMTEVVPPPEVRTALEAPFLNAKNGEALRISEEKAGEAARDRAKGQAEAVRIAADAQKYKDTTEAEGLAQARLREANSKKEAIEALAAAYGYKADGDKETNEAALGQATNYMLAEEAFGAIGELGSKGGTIIIPAGEEGAGALMGLVKGFMAKGLPTPKAAPPATPPPNSPVQ